MVSILNSVPKSLKKSPQKIILNQICNEDDPAIVRRCLMSIKPILDGYVILDNGSTREVLATIQECMAGLPGVLEHDHWDDFGQNRTRALKRAKEVSANLFPDCRSYVYLQDMDEQLDLPPGWMMPDFAGKPLLGFMMKLGNVVYPRPNFLSLEHDWHFEGPMHEELICGTQGIATAILQGPQIIVKQEGKRSKDPCRYFKDSETLRLAYEKDPKPRYLFYRGQALRGARLNREALGLYQECIAKGAVPEETWYAKLCIARLKAELDYPVAEVEHAFLDAYQTRPWRVESLASLAQYWRTRKEHELAFWACERAMMIPGGQDIYFAETLWYDGALEEEYCMNAFLAGHFQEAIAICEKRLLRLNLPVEEHERISKNLAAAREGLQKQKQHP